MTVHTGTQETFQAQLETDANGVLWLRDGDGMRHQLAVVLQGGWQIVDATPMEWAQLEAHGFASGWVQ